MTAPDAVFILKMALDYRFAIEFGEEMPDEVDLTRIKEVATISDDQYIPNEIKIVTIHCAEALRARTLTKDIIAQIDDDFAPLD